MLATMGGGSIEAARPVSDRIDIVAASKGPAWIGGPFVEVPHHVEYAISTLTVTVSSGRGNTHGQLVDAGILNMDEGIGCVWKELDGRMNITVIVALAHDTIISVGVGQPIGSLASA